MSRKPLKSFYLPIEGSWKPSALVMDLSTMFETPEVSTIQISADLLIELMRLWPSCLCICDAMVEPPRTDEWNAVSSAVLFIALMSPMPCLARNSWPREARFAIYEGL